MKRLFALIVSLGLFVFSSLGFSHAIRPNLTDADVMWRCRGWNSWVDYNQWSDVYESQDCISPTGTCRMKVGVDAFKYYDPNYACYYPDQPLLKTAVVTVEDDKWGNAYFRDMDGAWRFVTNSVIAPYGEHFKTTSERHYPNPNALNQNVGWQFLFGHPADGPTLIVFFSPKEHKW
jgi:hypothetical protein